MSNIKELKSRLFSKELRLYKVKSKSDLISKIIDVLNSDLSDDIHEVIEFVFNFNSELPLLNSDFYIHYKGLETSEEYKERLIKEEINKQNKLELLSNLAKELDYKLEKIDD